MAGIVRLSSPHLIRLGNGATYGSGAFFGQTAGNLTNTLRELQDTEAMKKLAEGDPETYLDYWKIRQRTATGALKDQMATYAARATAKLGQMKEDSEALASYAKTNNHQKYLTFLLGRLDKETDPTVISKLGTQIETLRGRVFAASGSGNGALGGGLSADAYNAARDKWNTTRLKYEGLTKDRPLTPAEFADLESNQREFETVLKTVIFSTDATQTRKDQFNTEMMASKGPNTDYIDNIASKSDALLLSKFKSDTDFAAQIAPLIAEKKFGEVAKMYAQRAQNLAVIAHQALNTPGAKAIGDWLNTAEASATKYAAMTKERSTSLSPSASEKIDTAYSNYWSVMTAAHKNDPSVPAPVNATVFKRQLAADSSAAQFAQDVGGTWQNATWQPLHEAATAFGPATYNSATGKYDGDPLKVADAKNSEEAIRMLMNTPGSQYSVFKDKGMSDPLSIQMILAGTLTPESLAKTQGATDRMAAGGNPGELTNNKQATQGQPAGETSMVSDSMGMSAADNNSAAAAGRSGSLAGDMATPASGPAPKNLAPQTLDHGDPRIAATSGIDTFLTQSDIGDLPDWTPPREDIPDVSSMFPFDNTPPPSISVPPVQAPDARDRNMVSR